MSNAVSAWLRTLSGPQDPGRLADEIDEMERVGDTAMFTVDGDRPGRPSSWRAVGPWRADYRKAAADAARASDVWS